MQTDLELVRQEAAKKYEEQRKLEKTREFAQNYKPLVNAVNSFFSYIDGISGNFDKISMTELLALQEKFKIVKSCVQSVLQLKDEYNIKTTEQRKDQCRGFAKRYFYRSHMS